LVTAMRGNVAHRGETLARGYELSTEAIKFQAQL
jgi:hypothetical protein